MHILFSDKPTWNKMQPHEPECSHGSHVKRFCETNYLNSLVHFSPVTLPVHCRLRNTEEGGVQSVGCEESGVLSVECSV